MISNITRTPSGLDVAPVDDYYNRPRAVLRIETNAQPVDKVWINGNNEDISNTDNQTFFEIEIFEGEYDFENETYVRSPVRDYEIAYISSYGEATITRATNTNNEVKIVSQEQLIENIVHITDDLYDLDWDFWLSDTFISFENSQRGEYSTYSLYNGYDNGVLASMYLYSEAKIYTRAPIRTIRFKSSYSQVEFDKTFYRDGQSNEYYDILPIIEGGDWVWDKNPLTNQPLPHTTSNYVVNGNKVIITIRSTAPLSSDFTYFYIPRVDRGREPMRDDVITTKTPTRIDMLENNMGAVITIEPIPQGQFYVENGELTKPYTIRELSENTVDIQFGRDKIEVFANNTEYALRNSAVLLKLYKIVNGEPEEEPTAYYATWGVDKRNSLFLSNHSLRLVGITTGKTFDANNYKFEFHNLFMLEPHTLKQSWSNIMFFDPNGSTDGYYTGEDYYE